MARGNLFQGMARGKVGDVVFYRMNGVQMSRVRNRAPKNPRTNEQLYQRAVIATTMKAYSAGKEIFDHAFQGYTVGEGCMRRFNSINARILRQQLAIDISEDRPEKGQWGRFVYPKSIVNVPFEGMQISEGTLTNNMIYVEEDDDLGLVMVPADENETIGNYLERMSTYPGDIYTVVFNVVNKRNPVYALPNIESDYAKCYESMFGFVRLIVKEQQDVSAIARSLKWNQIFDIEINGNFIEVSEDMTFQKTLQFPEAISLKDSMMCGCVGCIRSRIDVDVRSTAYMVAYNNMNFGISSGYVLAAWQNEITKIGTSELILEGGDEISAAAAINSKSASGISEHQAELAKLAAEPVQEGKRKPTRHRSSMPNSEG